MTHGFDKDYWEQHWQERPTGGALPANPYLRDGTRGLAPGAALDAGCGEGAEARWLATQGWTVTAADISSEALARAAERSAGAPVTWVEADLSTWEPGREYDLVMTHYAHPAMPQLAFYERIAGWVAPGGTLLIVGHLHAPASGHGHGHGHGHDGSDDTDDGQPPVEATVTLDGITARLDRECWEIVTAAEHARTVSHGEREIPLRDVVVRAVRSGGARRS